MKWPVVAAPLEDAHCASYVLARITHAIVALARSIAVTIVLTGLPRRRARRIRAWDTLLHGWRAKPALAQIHVMSSPSAAHTRPLARVAIRIVTVSVEFLNRTASALGEIVGTKIVCAPEKDTRSDAESATIHAEQVRAVRWTGCRDARLPRIQLVSASADITLAIPQPAQMQSVLDASLCLNH